MTKIDNEMQNELLNQAKIARAAILTMTTLAGSGHPGGSMSAIDFMLSLYKHIKHDPKNPQMPDRDRIVISNGHLSPAVYSALGLNGYFELDDAVSQFRLLGSIFEGHIEREVPGVEWSTGNLGQGLSAAAGMALASRINATPYRVYCIMGDGEQQKGQISEARRFAAKFKLNNLTAIVDYNQLQISGSIHEVMPQHIRSNWESDGWYVLEINGHDFGLISGALEAAEDAETPVMILAHTVMGKAVPFMENMAKYHGSALDEEQLEEALNILGVPNRIKDYRKARKEFKPPKTKVNGNHFALKGDLKSGQPIVYDKDTDNRSAWGNAIADLGMINIDSSTPIAVFDCDLAASVKTGEFAKNHPDNFIQSGIMEHHTSVAAGSLSACGIQTFWSDFGMFGIDEVYNMQRLNDINHANLKVVVTHVGLDVGEDGKTHQCIDYIGLTRNLYNFRLICPADPNHTDRIIRWLINKPGNYFVTMGRSKLSILKNDEDGLFYKMDYTFDYGMADVLRLGNDGCVIVCGTPAGNALKAVDSLREEGIYLQLIYISCPLAIDREILDFAAKTGTIFSIEDHNVHSGLGSIIADRLAEERICAKLVKIGVRSYPNSGTADDLYHWAGLDTESLIRSIKQELSII
ncbi:MAG: transketolase [Candidatus Cloacimonadaceae bacterium]|nr:transketolase [Candidatus Cloacimonadaceae bacterium]MDP3115046.1 transketolase [Candidatus Cloacimonadaceae bacterium]